MKVGVPKETLAGETRVALTPDMVQRLGKQGIEVHVERGAGETAYFPDELYEQAGAVIEESAADVHARADVIAKIWAPRELEGGGHELELLHRGQTLISFLYPMTNLDLVRRLAEAGVTVLAMDQVPRISRAQSMDALSSQSTVSGYMAVLQAAQASPRFLPMLTTAAGTIPPAKVVVLGAGVAGLQAIATARRLGAQVRAYDVRAATKEQVQSLGATFIDMPDFGEGDAETQGGYAKELGEERQRKEREHLAKFLAEADIVITTALIPGRPAPLLITREMASGMQPGSVILDMAAETGGNCELTEPGMTVEVDGVIVMGPVNMPNTLPVHASRMYARNIGDLLKLLAPEGTLTMNFEDEILDGATVIHDGAVRHPPTRELLGGDAPRLVSISSSPESGGGSGEEDAEDGDEDAGEEEAA